MTPADDATARDPIDLLVEEFLLRFRRGEVADVEPFAAAHPEQAAALRELLPALLALEQVRRDRASASGSGRRLASLPPLERLGDFRIVREVGRGGMGVVFEAVQESLGRRVALKVLPQPALLSGTQLQRFRREARVAAQLHHSHIVPVFGSGETDGFHWFAMQFIDGQSLDVWRHEQAATPPQDTPAWRERSRLVARLGQQAASALHYAHAQGTLHRDVKPGNLLLGHDGHLWVTDFGLAKALEGEGLTHSSDLLGTLQYMAPEQFAGHYDVRSEVYALGVTLYELLVLRPAFAGRSRSELMEQIRSLRPPPLRRVCPEVPDDLAVVVERAMAREPRDRYATAGDLADDLQAFLDDRPIAARRHNAAERLVRWCRQNRALAALAASTAVAVLGAAVTGWVAYGIADEALGRAQASAAEAARQTQLVASNLQLTLTAFDELFDALVGRDPALAVDEDPETGEQTVVARTVVEPRHVDLLQRMLDFYDRFAAANADDQSLRFETARAHRRVAAIQARLGNLDAAVASYQEALSYFLAVGDRDVRREVAAVHVDCGQIEQRRGRPGEAAQRFALAIEWLGPDQPGDSRALRFERAQAHFLLARRPGPGPGPGRFRADGAPALETAQAILRDLLEQNPQHPEYRALQARCLLEAGRRRGTDRDQGPAAERDHDAALAIFRQLVAERPDADQYAYELCEALWSDARRLPPVDAGRLREQIVRLREARLLAQRLTEQQPDFAEYRLLRSNVGSTLGRLLLRLAATEASAAAALRREAEDELRAALALAPAVDGEGATVRQLLPTLATRAALVLLLAETDRGDEAVREAAALVAGLRQVGRDERRPRLPLPEPRTFELVEGMLRRQGRGELAAELRALRESLPAERPGPQPRRPR
ncbi:MAG: serine/threonine protein kinase [Planctomycetes bacterium]|nr:serine/threonine protein kinase [Planctomycetota bacterium]